MSWGNYRSQSKTKRVHWETEAALSPKAAPCWWQGMDPNELSLSHNLRADWPEVTRVREQPPPGDIMRWNMKVQPSAPQLPAGLSPTLWGLV